MTDQKVAIITGASQGIGAALVDAYRGLGYAVVANSRSITPSADARVATVPGDIADPATAEAIVTTAVERFGRVDTLVNNAGVFIGKPFTEYSAADYALATSVTTSWHTARSSP
jgi:NAD(P)-dependent dehydrogenase (short-subunit alcohol dehydrogenase family)